MPDDPETMRGQARRCRRLASETTDHATSLALAQLAEEYDRRALTDGAGDVPVPQAMQPG